jgi:hypothetical protein
MHYHLLHFFISSGKMKQKAIPAAPSSVSIPTFCITHPQNSIWKYSMEKLQGAFDVHHSLSNNLAICLAVHPVCWQFDQPETIAWLIHTASQ